MAHWIVIQTSENLIASLLIKRQRLKIKGIAMGVKAPASQRFTFRSSHQTAANSTPPMTFSDPELLDK